MDLQSYYQLSYSNGQPSSGFTVTIDKDGLSDTQIYEIAEAIKDIIGPNMGEGGTPVVDNVVFYSFGATVVNAPPN
jgi:hypothetical protein